MKSIVLSVLLLGLVSQAVSAQTESKSNLVQLLHKQIIIGEQRLTDNLALSRQIIKLRQENADLKAVSTNDKLVTDNAELSDQINTLSNEIDALKKQVARQNASSSRYSEITNVDNSQPVLLADLKKECPKTVVIQQQWTAHDRNLWRSVIPKDPNRKVFGTSEDLKVWPDQE